MSVLTFQNISMTYQDGSTEITALHPTNFTIESGEFIAIIGPSGSGKSTFLTIAGGLQKATTGSLHINGTNYATLTEKERSKLRFKDIGFILQSSNLIPFLTVKQQFDLVDKLNPSGNHLNLDDLLTHLDLTHLMHKLPKVLSGGERQRVAIARALYNNPSIILADEPTASLDTKRAIEVAELLAKESKKYNKAIIMVTHDHRIIEHCDKVYTMKDGVLSLTSHPA